ncbi:MAG: hypothetical protein M3P51_00905, partial [Chloroflexota bacterium]|nr:hypothetical protein [Chloroflexota bacterium]
MPPTSTHSVTGNGASDNTPDTAILSSFTEITRSLEAQGIHDEARALHDLIPEVRRITERTRLAEENNRRWREQWEHTSTLFALPSSQVSPADKLILWRLRGEALRRKEEGIAGPAPVLIGDVATERGTVQGLASAVGMSAGQVGKRLKAGAEACGAITRTEDKDPKTGRTRVLVEFTNAYWHPERLKREEPRNQGGTRKPRCVRCGSEKFTPVAWECKGCGITYDLLPFPPEEPPEDPDPAPPGNLPASPRNGESGGDADPPTSNIADHGDTQWGGGPNPQVAGWPTGGAGAEEIAAAVDDTLPPPLGNLAVDPPAGSEPAVPPIEVSVVEAPASAYPADDPEGGELAEEGSIPTTNLQAGPPEELKPWPQWVAWRSETTADGRSVKPPYRPDNPGRRADVGDPATWGTYERALSASPEGRVGFVLTAGDPYAVADLDGCRDPGTGELEAWARGVVEALDSYTEISPSGRGLHVWVRGELPGLRRRGGGVELYDRARYVTVTGEALPGYEHREIAERGAELAALYRRLFGEPQASTQPAQYSAWNTAPAGSAGDGDLLGRAMRVSWFPAVWGGDDSHYGGDPSKG